MTKLIYTKEVSIPSNISYNIQKNNQMVSSKKMKILIFMKKYVEIQLMIVIL